MIELYGRSLLTLKDFSAEEIFALLKLAHKLKRKKREGVRGDLLQSKNILLLFEKASTRTRVAFELAAKEEGANVTFLSNSHFGSKESLEDSAKVFARFYDGIEFRGYQQQTVNDLATYSGIPVWNGLTDQFHPTQALADLMTIEEHCNKPLKQVKLVYVGDGRNNVATSLMIAAAKLGMHFVILAPTEYHPTTENLQWTQQVAKTSGAEIKVYSEIQPAVQHADVLYTDVWISMGEEKQMAERIKLLTPYQVNQSMLTTTENQAVKFMHCLPACHDRMTEVGEKVFQSFALDAMEVTDDVFRSKHSIVFDQAENRLPTIKAVMVATLCKNGIN